MKAAVVEKPGVLVVREVPRPLPGPYDVLCRLLYGATCTGTDQHIIRGSYPFPLDYPTILGHECIGRVVDVGPKVRNFRKGDLLTRVGTPPVGGLNVNWGGFAEYGIARDHRAMKEDGCRRELWDMYRVNQVLPDDMDPAAATMIITWRETLSYITRSGVSAGSRILIIGSGANGFSFALHARHLGAIFVAVIGSSGRREIAESTGVDTYVDYKDEDVASQLREVSPEGFDFIIDAVGRRGQLDRVLDLLRPGGTVGIYGVDEFNDCALHPQKSRGTFIFYNGGSDEEESHERVLSLIRDGALEARIFLGLDRVYPLAEISRAFDAVRGRRVIKAVVKLSDQPA